jgi:hypothetical protein
VSERIGNFETNNRKKNKTDYFKVVISDRVEGEIVNDLALDLELLYTEDGIAVGTEADGEIEAEPERLR